MLVVYALQIISMGKTPFGDIRRSRTVILFGVIISAIGIVACFIPDIFGNVPRILLIIFFGAGGIILFLQMLLGQNRYRLWRKYGGIFNHPKSLRVAWSIPRSDIDCIFNFRSKPP